MKDFNWLKTAYIAHRGLHKENGSIPENSIAAFKAAIANHYAIECDLSLTKDGNIIVFHDHNLKRLTGLNKKVEQVNYDELKDLNLFISNEKIPRLEELLTLVGGKVPLLIELKPHGNMKKLCQTFMHHMEKYQGKWAVFSFHPKVVLWFKKNYPDVVRGQISAYFDDVTNMPRPLKFLMKRMFFNHLTKPDFISYNIRNLPNKHVDRQKKKGITIISYAARNQKDFDFVKDYYHNVVFEYFIPKKSA